MNLKNIILFTLATLITLTAFTCFKIIISSQREFDLAEEYLAKNKISPAINHYERALQWYLPLSQTPYQAAEKLWQIAENQQAQNQNMAALKTYRILRGAFYSIRSTHTPGEDWIHRCNDKISHLMASQFIDSQATPKTSFTEKKSQYLKLLEAERPPLTMPSIVAIAGFFGWVTSVLLFIFKALSPQGDIKRKPGMVFAATFSFFYMTWIWGLLNT